MGVYVTFDSSPLKSSSLEDGETNKLFAATSKRASGRSARKVLTRRRHPLRGSAGHRAGGHSRPQRLPPPLALRLQSVPASRPWQRGGRRGRWLVPARPLHKPQADAVAVFFGVLTRGSECSFLDISVSPWGREDWSLFINEYFGADLA